jgi:Zn-dependent M28 family amino/carboxypeptidase
MDQLQWWIALIAAASTIWPAPLSGQIRYQTLTREVINARLHSFAGNDFEREERLRTMFAQSGCKQENLSEQIVKKKQPPNIICVLPGSTDQIVVVGAHFDHVPAGDGVVDNWTGASLLPSLLDSVRQEPRQHTYIFIGFMGEEQGMLGSQYYVAHLKKEERGRIHAMINFDTLGLGKTEVWISHSDARLVRLVDAVSQAMKIPLGGVNVERVGSTDSESFGAYKIPRITLHSLTQETLTILHTSKDQMDKIQLGDYYQSYQLIAAYLIALDSLLESKPTPPLSGNTVQDPRP